MMSDFTFMIPIKSSGAILGTPGVSFPPMVQRGECVTIDIPDLVLNDSYGCDIVYTPKTVQRFYCKSVSWSWTGTIPMDTSGDGSLSNPWKNAVHAMRKIECLIASTCDLWFQLVFLPDSVIDYQIVNLLTNTEQSIFNMQNRFVLGYTDGDTANRFIIDVTEIDTSYSALAIKGAVLSQFDIKANASWATFNAYYSVSILSVCFVVANSINLYISSGPGINWYPSIFRFLYRYWESGIVNKLTAVNIYYTGTIPNPDSLYLLYNDNSGDLLIDNCTITCTHTSSHAAIVGLFATDYYYTAIYDSNINMASTSGTYIGIKDVCAISNTNIKIIGANISATGIRNLDLGRAVHGSFTNYDMCINNVYIKIQNIEGVPCNIRGHNTFDSITIKDLRVDWDADWNASRTRYVCIGVTGTTKSLILSNVTWNIQSPITIGGTSGIYGSWGIIQICGIYVYQNGDVLDIASNGCDGAISTTYQLDTSDPFYLIRLLCGIKTASETKATCIYDCVVDVINFNGASGGTYYTCSNLPNFQNDVMYW